MIPVPARPDTAKERLNHLAAQFPNTMPEVHTRDARR
jgi:hypothetical protein